MSDPQRKRRPFFVLLPRHKRATEVLSLKGKILRDTAKYGGRFTSFLQLDEPERPALYCQSFSFYFPGTDRFTIWNADIVTARKAFWDEVTDIAYNRVSAGLTHEELEEDTRVDFVPAQRSSTGKVLTYTMVERERMRFEKFGGRTFHEQWCKLESEIARNEPPPIHESFKLDRRYDYGIHLQIVIDAEVVDRTAVETAIDHFFAIGEMEWTSLEPIPRERLPSVSQDEALAAFARGEYGERGLPQG